MAVSFTTFWAQTMNENLYNKPEFPCSACTLYREPGPVLGFGNRNAAIMYVAELPGPDEVDEPRRRPDRFRPLIGGSGRIHNVICEQAGIHRDTQTFRTNCVKCRPPGGRAATPYEIECCAKFLVEEIEDVQPNVIVAAGEVALNVLCDKKKIGNWRGVPIEGPTLRTGGFDLPDATGDGAVAPTRLFKVFPTWNPAFVMRQQHNWAFAVHDLVRAKAEAAYPELIRIPIDINSSANHTDHADALRRAVRARGAVTFDFETTGLRARDSTIKMCGFVGRPDQAEVYDWSSRTAGLLQEFLDDPEIEVCGQNILYFDLPYFEEKGAKVDYSRKIFDTMVVFHLCNSSYGQTPIHEQNAGKFNPRGSEKDLTMIASVHTDIPYWKSREDYRDNLKGVCGLDVIATDRAAYHPTAGLKRELISYGMENLYYNHILPVHPVLRRMSDRGFRIDQGRAASWKLLLQQNADELEAALKEGLSDPSLNLNSPKQLMTLLYDKLGLPVQFVRDKKGTRPTANAEALEHLASLHPDNAILTTIVDIRHLRKMESTYIDPGLESEDERLHPKFGVSKAANGRFNGWDPNAQNVPEEMRDIWIPDSPDCVILSADASQIEWRNAMVLSGDPVGLELLARGVDNHRAVAAETLGKRIEGVTDEERHASKFIVYGLGYGRGAESIAEGHNLDRTFVDTFVKNFFRRFARFAAWREEQVALVKKNNFIVNPWMRRRWWYTRMVTEVYNYPASSCAADMMIDELIALDRQLPKGATLRLTVHDEVVLNVQKDVIRLAWECVRDVMQMKWPQMVEHSSRPETVRKFYPDGWFCPADIHLGTNWKMCKSKDSADKVARAELERYLGVAA